MNIVDLAEQIDQGAAWLRDAHNTAMEMLDEAEATEAEIAISPWLFDLARVQKRLADITSELQALLSLQQTHAVAEEERRLSDLADAAEALQ